MRRIPPTVHDCCHVPAEHRWYRNLLVAKVLVETLESLDMHYPKPAFDPKEIVIL